MVKAKKMRLSVIQDILPPEMVEKNPQTSSYQRPLPSSAYL